MAYQLSDINFKTVSDPKGFIEEGDAAYYKRLDEVAELIINNLRQSPIVLMSGPSGSGKTTTSMKLAETLMRRGVNTHYVSMDDYFISVDPLTAPRTPEGDLDLESPLCLDMELLNEHFRALSEGRRIFVPKYEFSRQMRVTEPGKSIKLHQDEIVVFEGIHALNDVITDQNPDAFRFYISARSDVEFNGQVVFKGTWFRLVRRMVRDYNFRGASPAVTMAMWANVRRGEKANISPFKNKANYLFDSSFPYEMAVMNRTATKLFESVPEGIARFEELKAVLPALQLFGEIDEKYVAPDAMIREFIGGGIYEY